MQGAAYLIGSIYLPKVSKQFENASLTIEIVGEGTVYHADYLHISLTANSRLVLFSYSLNGFTERQPVLSLVASCTMLETISSIPFNRRCSSQECPDVAQVVTSASVKILPIGKAKTVLAKKSTGRTALAQNTPQATPTPELVPVATPTRTILRVTSQPTSAVSGKLPVGEMWIQNELGIRVKNTTYIPGCRGVLGFEMSIINLSGKEVKVDISGTDFSVSDEQGKVYSSEELWWQEGMSSEDCYPNQLSDFYLKSLKAGERKDIAIRVVLSRQSASAIFQITCLPMTNS